jgi:epoxyqueuosine reductase
VRLPAAFTDLAYELGFDSVGVCSPKLDISVGLNEWLAAGYHGDMAWMEARANQRASPLMLWSEVKSVIVLGMNYAPASIPTSEAAISVYAQGDDYHEVIKPRLKQLARVLGGDLKVFVDTAPVPEKALAALAGIGWQGKHSNLVSKDFGSWLFLGVIYSALEFQDSEAERNHCGSCVACLNACPTNAFPSPYVVDAKRCISYLTIENKGTIPLEFRKAIGNKIYGCDDCLAVCPWNKFASTARLNGIFAREELKSPTLASFLVLDDANFRALFRKSPVKRIGRDRFIRNCLVAAGNSGDKTLVPLIEILYKDPSPLVQEMAEWALGELKSVSRETVLP